MKAPIIRQATVADCGQIAELFHHTVMRTNIRDYTLAQVRAWAEDAPNPVKWKERQRKRTTFVWEEGGRILGFAEYEANGHVDAVYVGADSQKRGIATRLLAEIEQLARAQGVVRLVSEVSITARHCFEKNGYVALESQDVTYASSQFRNYKMEKRLLTASDSIC